MMKIFDREIPFSRRLLFLSSLFFLFFSALLFFRIPPLISMLGDPGITIATSFSESQGRYKSLTYKYSVNGATYEGWVGKYVLNFDGGKTAFVYYNKDYPNISWLIGSEIFLLLEALVFLFIAAFYGWGVVISVRRWNRQESRKNSIKLEDYFKHK